MVMRVKSTIDNVEGDMTPMIDMTFQLIAFFMVLINFNAAETNERIQLPESVLARPPEGPSETPITLQVTKEGTVLVGGEEMSLEAIKGPLGRERRVLETLGKRASDATIIVRAHKHSKTGVVQNVIKECQINQFEKFVLRAQEDTNH